MKRIRVTELNLTPTRWDCRAWKLSGESMAVIQHLIVGGRMEESSLRSITPIPSVVSVSGNLWEACWAAMSVTII